MAGLEEVGLVVVGDEAVLAEEFAVVGLGESFEVGEFGLELGVPVLVVIEDFGVEVVGKQGAAGGEDAAGVVGLDGENIAGGFVAVNGFYRFYFNRRDAGRTDFGFRKSLSTCKLQPATFFS